MGCCMSSSTKTDPHYAKAPTRHRSPLKPPSPEPKRSHVTITPPPASLEEETVKEVLSETPIPKPPHISPVQEPKIQPQNFTNNKRIKEEKQEEAERTPEISQASEICSVTDTYSTATTTTTVTEIREDEVTSRKRVNRSPAKVPRKRPYNGERERVAKIPARREKLPVKRELSGQARTTQRNVGPNRVGRDLGERSSRRSTSPATRTTAGGVVKGRAGGSPAKMTGKSGGKPAEVGVGSEVQKEEKSENDNVLMQQGNESLENPLVSLECFIFL